MSMTPGLQGDALTPRSHASTARYPASLRLRRASSPRSQMRFVPMAHENSEREHRANLADVGNVRKSYRLPAVGLAARACARVREQARTPVSKHVSMLVGVRGATPVRWEARLRVPGRRAWYATDWALPCRRLCVTGCLPQLIPKHGMSGLLLASGACCTCRNRTTTGANFFTCRSFSKCRG